jgi:hypothetical protein
LRRGGQPKELLDLLTTAMQQAEAGAVEASKPVRKQKGRT